MRKLFLIFCSAVVLTTSITVVGLSGARDHSLFTTVSQNA